MPQILIGQFAIEKTVTDLYSLDLDRDDIITAQFVAKQWTDLDQWSGGTGTYTLPRSAIDGSAEGSAPSWFRPAATAISSAPPKWS